MINNVPVTFVFNPTTGMVTGVMNLIKGVNRLRIEANQRLGFPLCGERTRILARKGR